MPNKLDERATKGNKVKHIIRALCPDDVLNIHESARQAVCFTVFPFVTLSSSPEACCCYRYNSENAI